MIIFIHYKSKLIVIQYFFFGTTMDILNINTLDLKPAYGIFCGTELSKFYMDSLFPSFCKIPAYGATTPHQHFETEIFFILKGSGKITIENESQMVGPGDLIKIHSNTLHHLENTGNSSLEFISMYTEDYEPKLPRSKIIITAAPPTPNGPLHLGHISGPYLAADVLSRHLKSLNCLVEAHSGTDDHQNYVSEHAYKANETVDVFQAKQRKRILNGLKQFSISFDEFIEPKSNTHYQKNVIEFAQQALEKQIIEEEYVEFPFCSTCSVGLIDSLASGLCPSCHYPSHGCCENCGLVVPPFDLHDVKCSRCGNPADTREKMVHTFNLSKYLKLIQSDLKAIRLPAKFLNLVETILTKNNFKVLVSHPYDGQSKNVQLAINFPNTNNAIHVWFEMAAHYQTFSKSDHTWIHCFGFDNSFYYLLFIPSLLKALGMNSKLPDGVVMNDFLLLDGLKFSTSRNHAIWADECKDNSDLLRFYLSSIRPNKNQSNFSQDEFDTFSNKVSFQLKELRKRYHIVRSHQDVLSSECEQECQRIKREVNFYLSFNSLNISQAAERILLFLNHSYRSLGHCADDRKRIETLFQILNVFMPNLESL